MAIFDTRNFHIVSDDDPDSVARASAIGATCEADLAFIEQLFSTNLHAGTELWPIWVLVPTVVPGGTSAATNSGYRPGAFTVVRILETYTPTVPIVDPGLAVLEFNELARQLFVAELVEIVMAYTGLFWPRDSTGEGLSIYISSLLHPKGYYLSAGTSPGAGPRIINWLQTPDPTKPSQRQDWVSNTEQTDGNFVSFGCAKLFLHYLVSQLNYPIEKVIQAAGIGTPLSVVYNRLSLNPASQAFTDFASLVDTHFPLGSPLNLFSPSVMGSDNIFPLLDISRRRVDLSSPSKGVVRVVPKDASTIDPYGPTILLKPGPFCLPRQYFCGLSREIDQISTAAVCTGFFSARIKFKVNGVELTTIGNWDTITVPAETTLHVPEQKRVTTSTQATISYVVLPAWNESFLFMKNTTTEGTFTLEIVASANETAANDAFVASDVQSADVTALTLVLEDRYYRDRAACNHTFYKVGIDLKSMSATLADAFNRPDPLPDGMLVDLISAARSLELTLSRAADESGLRRSEILHECYISGETKVPVRVDKVRPETQVVPTETKVPPVISQVLAAYRLPKA